MARPKSNRIKSEGGFWPLRCEPVSQTHEKTDPRLGWKLREPNHPHPLSRTEIVVLVTKPQFVREPLADGDGMSRVTIRFAVSVGKIKLSQMICCISLEKLYRKPN